MKTQTFIYPPEELQEREKQFAALFAPAGDDGGQEVLYVYAKECMELYKKEMSGRGIIHPNDAFTPPVTVQERLDVSYAVKYDGFKLKEWVLARYYGNSQRAHLGFKLAFGIYTEAFLLKYYPDNPDERARRFHRTTAFIVPYYTIPTLEKIADDEPVYNLGGLEP